MPRMTGLPWLTLIWTTLTAGLWLLAGPAPEALIYQRSALIQGEAWRWLSGHLVHSSTDHALWDITALGLIGLLLEGQGRLRLILAAATGVVAVDVALWWTMPEIERYCGLSGLLNTLFVVTLADHWRQHPLVPLIALGWIVKLTLELITQQSLVIDMAWPSLPEAHLAGGLGGVGFVVVERFGRVLWWRSGQHCVNPGLR